MVGLAGALVSAEVLLRVVRGAPGPPELDIVIEPGGKYQAPDPVLGFRPLPGSYIGLFDHRDVWHFTNLPDTTRITRPVEAYTDTSRGPGIWVFGCSFVQGCGLSDTDTFPWKIQERFPAYDVVNFGVGGAWWYWRTPIFMTSGTFGRRPGETQTSATTGSEQRPSHMRGLMGRPGCVWRIPMMLRR